MLTLFINNDRYEPAHTIGAHADNESGMFPEAPIFSFSFGGTRDFVVRPLKTKKGGTGGKTQTFIVEDGDLIIMGGTLQRTHEHEVPLSLLKATRNRINFTCRSFVGEAFDESKQKRREKEDRD